MKKPIIIVGCARSGTKYIQKVLFEAGLDIGHERVRNDGISSWTSVAVLQNLFKNLQNMNPAIVHQVRHPLNAISSIQTIRKKSWGLIYKVLGINPKDPIIVKCMKYWRHWNLLAETVSNWTYQIEMLHCLWEEFCEKIGRPEIVFKKNKALGVQANVNSRKNIYKKFKVEDLVVADEKLFDLIDRQAVRYGYEAMSCLQSERQQT